MMFSQDYYGFHLFLFTNGGVEEIHKFKKILFTHVEITKAQRNVLTDLHIVTVIMAKTLWILLVYSM